MIITRKIEIYLAEKDKEQKTAFIKTVYKWRNFVRNGANELLSYLYSVEKLKYYKFITEGTKIELGIIGAKGEPVKEMSANYVLLSERMKGEIPMDIANCLQQSVSKTYRETKKDLLLGNSTLRTYKNTIPIPFSGKSITHFNWDAADKRFYFNLFGLPFATHLGRDRSNNKVIIDRVLSSEYKLCQSAIQINDTKKKMFLLLCVDIPKTEVVLEEKEVFAFLGIETPITAMLNQKMVTQIGTKEEYLHNRLQIQAALHRLQKACKYNTGAHGRKAKLQAIERFELKERNYVATKLHLYSRLLVDWAIKNKCNKIVLVNQEEKEDDAKQTEFLLRNWGYYNLNTLIEYKAKMVGIQVLKQSVETIKM